MKLNTESSTEIIHRRKKDMKIISNKNIFHPGVIEMKLEPDNGESDTQK